MTLTEVAQAWMRYQHRYQADGDPGIHDPDWWAVDAWMAVEWWADENRVRAGLLELVAAAETDADFGTLGAAIMELFVTDDERRLGWLEQQAAHSEPFHRSLRNVHIWGEQSDVIAQRVEAAAAARLPRPAATLNAEQVATRDAATRLRQSAAALRAFWENLDRDWGDATDEH